MIGPHVSVPRGGPAFDQVRCASTVRTRQADRLPPMSKEPESSAPFCLDLLGMEHFGKAKDAVVILLPHLSPPHLVKNSDDGFRSENVLLTADTGVQDAHRQRASGSGTIPTSHDVAEARIGDLELRRGAIRCPAL